MEQQQRIKELKQMYLELSEIFNEGMINGKDKNELEEIKEMLQRILNELATLESESNA